MLPYIPIICLTYFVLSDPTCSSPAILAIGFILRKMKGAFYVEAVACLLLQFCWQNFLVHILVNVILKRNNLWNKIEDEWMNDN